MANDDRAQFERLLESLCQQALKRAAKEGPLDERLGKMQQVERTKKAVFWALDHVRDEDVAVALDMARAPIWERNGD